MMPLESAILRTVLYADIFKFPLTLAELHRYLIHHCPIQQGQLRDSLQQSATLGDLLWQGDGYIGLKGHESYLMLRKQREQLTEAMWEQAHRYGQWFGSLPFVRMVGLTGALAVRNPAGIDDDYDYILVTEPGRVWLARACAVLLVRLMKLRGIVLCPNYVLAKTQIQQQQQDLYMAHELMQMVPIYGGALYSEMIAANTWARDYLPNAQPFAQTIDQPSRLKRFVEWLLGSRVGNWLESWEYRRKLRKFQPEMTQTNYAAKVDAERVKGHFQDHGSPVLERFEQLQAEYGLLEVPAEAIAQTGD